MYDNYWYSHCNFTKNITNNRFSKIFLIFIIYLKFWNFFKSTKIFLMHYTAPNQFVEPTLLSSTFLTWHFLFYTSFTEMVILRLISHLLKDCSIFISIISKNNILKSIKVCLTTFTKIILCKKYIFQKKARFSIFF